MLEAHTALSQVEQSRDDLLFELHRVKQKQYSSVDKDLLCEYFTDASKLSVKLEKKLNSILGNTLNTVRQNPKVIVTALRVIEREEKLEQVQHPTNHCVLFLVALALHCALVKGDNENKSR